MESIVEFAEKVTQFADRVNRITGDIASEEATKSALVMPFFQLLGYDIFNPKEFIPEYTADVGIKKGERVDYAIIVNGEPLILLEVKPYGENLDGHIGQLFRYFSTVHAARFGILTDGVVYRFYTDIMKANILDTRPFLELNLANLKESHIAQLAQFQKGSLDVDGIMGSAENAMFVNMIKDWLARQFAEPTEELIKLCLSEIYGGNRTQKVIASFRPLFKTSMEQFQIDFLNSRFRSAIKDTMVTQAQPEEPAPDGEDESPDTEITLEDIEAFAIVKSILYGTCDVSRLVLRPTSNYVVVDYDGNSRKRIIRFWFRGKTKYVTTPDEKKVPVRCDIDDLNDIFKLAATIREVAQRYL